MINRILGYLFFFDLILALFIALAFVESGQPIKPLLLGPGFTSFITNCSRTLTLNKIVIPDIPKVDYLTSQDKETININNAWDVIRYSILQYQTLVDFFNFFITLLNGLISGLNALITIVNYILLMFEFLGIVIENFYLFITNSTDNPSFVEPITPPWGSICF